MSDDQAIPEGLVLQHTLYGEPANLVTHAWTAGQVQPAPFSGVAWNGVEDEHIPYVPPENERGEDRVGFCKANNDTCKGKAMRNSDFCPPHAGVLRGRGHKGSPEAAIEDQPERSEEEPE